MNFVALFLHISQFHFFRKWQTHYSFFVLKMYLFIYDHESIHAQRMIVESTVRHKRILLWIYVCQLYRILYLRHLNEIVCMCACLRGVCHHFEKKQLVKWFYLKFCDYTSHFSKCGYGNVTYLSQPYRVGRHLCITRDATAKEPLPRQGNGNGTLMNRQQKIIPTVYHRDAQITTYT